VHYASEARERVGSVIDQRFRIEKLLGAGGMGAVYVATASNGHRYALKLLLHDRLGSNAQMVARFVREARLAASIETPNVVKTYECGVDAESGAPFIAMELLDGFDVEALVQNVGPVDPAVAARIIIQAAQGLSVAHAAGIVHRDIKPANIFLHRRSSSAGPRGREVVVKVCDFGIAKAVIADNESLTVTGTPLGTPLYLSPEQMRSAKHVDARTDVWSLGMSLWTMLAGRSAFEGATTLAELFVAICTQDIPWLQDVAPWVDPALAKVVHGTLLRELPQRCPDLGALIDALAPFAGPSAQLFEQELVGANELTKSHSAPRAARVQSWSESVPQGGKDPAVDPALQTLVGSVLGGRYRLDRLLGAGGMGAVYEATSQRGEHVAVKVVLGDPDRQRPELLRRFVREAKSTMAIDSPNVVRVVDVDADPQRGFPFIVMELLSGVDLDKLIRQNGALDPTAVAKLFMQACRGLHAAHAKGILHRDVKPANVFLHQTSDGRVAVKICDFGIAKQVNPEGDQHGAVSTELTRTGGVLGSPMYMSPEQARSAKHVDSTSDVWSLGAALYEALSGRRLWEGHTTVGDLIIAICTKDVTPLQEIAPWIEPGLAEAVHKALQREPSARHASMEAFAQALAPFAGSGELLVAALAPVPEQVRSRVAQRSTSVPGVSSVAAHSVSTTSSPQRSGKRVALVAVAAVAVLGGAIAAVSLGGARNKADNAAAGPPATTTEPTTKPEKPTEKTSVTSVRVTLKITPPDAEVLVDGKTATSFAGGVLTLEGEPGDSFQIVAKSGTRAVNKQVFIGKDRKASVEAIEVPIETKTASGAVKPATTKPGTKETAAAKETVTAAPPPPPPHVEKPPPPPPATAGTPIGASTF